MLRYYRVFYFLFLRFRVRGTQRARRYTTTLVWVPAELRGGCFGSPKSSKLAHRFQGIAFCLSEQRRTIEIHNFRFLFYVSLCCLLPPYLYYIVPQAPYSLAAAVKQQSRFEVCALHATATNGASLCAYVCVFVCTILRSTISLACPLNFRSTRAAKTVNSQQVQ